MAKRQYPLAIDVAFSSIACAADGCVRVVAAGDVLFMRRLEGTACSEPLCPVCGAEAVEDLRLRARIRMHAAAQATLDSTTPALAPGDSPDPNTHCSPVSPGEEG